MDLFAGKQKMVASGIATFVLATATALLTALTAAGEGAGFGDLTTAAWLTVIIGVLSTTGAVSGATYAVGNEELGDWDDVELGFDVEPDSAPGRHVA